jgi:hypothetical protein
MTSPRAFPLLLLLLAFGLAGAQPAEYRNWYHDPFFQISSAIDGCPLPAGPYQTESEQRLQAHHRAEEGTSCWLAGKCERSNSYAYDQDIAASIRANFANRGVLTSSTLWITVRGRNVFIEGCVHDLDVAPELEAIVRMTAEVEQAMALVYTGPSATPPYKVLPDSSVRK